MKIQLFLNKITRYSAVKDDGTYLFPLKIISLKILHALELLKLYQNQSKNNIESVYGMDQNGFLTKFCNRFYSQIKNWQLFDDFESLSF